MESRARVVVARGTRSRARLTTSPQPPGQSPGGRLPTLPTASTTTSFEFRGRGEGTASRPRRRSRALPSRKARARTRRLDDATCSADTLTLFISDRRDPSPALRATAARRSSSPAARSPRRANGAWAGARRAVDAAGPGIMRVTGLRTPAIGRTSTRRMRLRVVTSEEHCRNAAVFMLHDQDPVLARDDQSTWHPGDQRLRALRAPNVVFGESSASAHRRAHLLADRGRSREALQLRARRLVGPVRHRPSDPASSSDSPGYDDCQNPAHYSAPAGMQTSSVSLHTASQLDHS